MCFRFTESTPPCQNIPLLPRIYPLSTTMLTESPLPKYTPFPAITCDSTLIYPFRPEYNPFFTALCGTQSPRIYPPIWKVCCYHHIMHPSSNMPRLKVRIMTVFGSQNIPLPPALLSLPPQEKSWRFWSSQWLTELTVSSRITHFQKMHIVRRLLSPQN